MQKFTFMNSFQLKVLAIIFMTIDHVGYVLYPQYIVLRYIGRLAFPIFAFLIVEGMIYTRDARKYLARLGAFALISEIPFDLAFRNTVFYWDKQNVFFTLFIGAIGIYIWQSKMEKYTKYSLVFIVSLLAELIASDYGMVGVWLILGIYYVRDKNKIYLLWVLIIMNMLFMGGIQNYAVLAFIPLLSYNGKKGYGMKYFFYLYYPAHLLVLYYILHYVK